MKLNTGTSSGYELDDYLKVKVGYLNGVAMISSLAMLRIY